LRDNWVICLGAGEFHVTIIKYIKLLGYKVLAIDRNPKALGFNFSDEVLVESTYNADKILCALKGRQWCGLVCRCTGQPLFTAAHIFKYLKMSGITNRLADISTSKSALRGFASTNSIIMPNGMKISSVEEYDETAFGNEIIIKPDFTIVGKKSIKKITNNCKSGLFQAIENSIKYSGNNYVEVEAFVEGYDCTFLVWFDHGKSTTLVVWDEVVEFLDNGDLCALGVSIPSVSVWLKNHVKTIEKIIANVAEVLSDVRSILAFSFRVDKNGTPFLIEVHADLTGDLILDELVPAAGGINYFLNIVKLILGNNLSAEISELFDNKQLIPTALMYEENNNFKIFSESSLPKLHERMSEYLNGKILSQKIAIDNPS
jgi:hypothetical protein